eukprot:CAMPEP_0195133870 /NCGR_PEP_ID=MMETSP0448-20130528/149545_1 /TAXON_ID=66468 /ORGANISM="Heterocapsa triquestra, Strain CCMP 448" /LENGTH=128 /DNA_ID=CAMNT_0040171935 /DNA_START=1 /DNA_END=384 /DNA_ORIENTATION=+
MGMGGGYADSMFRMTQMLEMNSIMLDQLQEHVSMTYNRFRDIAVWVWALKDTWFKRDPAEAVHLQGRFDTQEAKGESLARVKQRAKVLLTLFGLFLFLVLRDSLKRRRNLDADSAWMKAAAGLLPVAR